MKKKIVGMILAFAMTFACLTPQGAFAAETLTNCEAQILCDGQENSENTGNIEGTESTENTDNTESTQITRDTENTGNTEDTEEQQNAQAISKDTVSSSEDESAKEEQADADQAQESENAEIKEENKESEEKETTKAPAVKNNACQKKQTVKKSSATIRLKKTKVSLERGEKVKLKAVVKNASSKKIIWKSSKKRVATVNQKGKVTAKDKGRTVVTARIKGTNITAECVVVVKKYITMTVKTTGYCNCSKCAGQWAGAPTAFGTRPKQNRTIAVDKRLIKLGTKVKIGKEMYVAEDTGGAIKGKKIDIYYSSHRRAQAHGVKYQKIKVYI